MNDESTHALVAERLGGRQRGGVDLPAVHARAASALESAGFDDAPETREATPETLRADVPQTGEEDPLALVDDPQRAAGMRARATRPPRARGPAERALIDALDRDGHRSPSTLRTPRRTPPRGSPERQPALRQGGQSAHVEREVLRRQLPGHRAGERRERRRCEPDRDPLAGAAVVRDELAAALRHEPVGVARATREACGVERVGPLPAPGLPAGAVEVEQHAGARRDRHAVELERPHRARRDGGEEGVGAPDLLHEAVQAARVARADRPEVLGVEREGMGGVDDVHGDRDRRAEEVQELHGRDPARQRPAVEVAVPGDGAGGRVVGRRVAGGRFARAPLAQRVDPGARPPRRTSARGRGSCPRAPRAPPACRPTRRPPPRAPPAPRRRAPASRRRASARSASSTRRARGPRARRARLRPRWT